MANTYREDDHLDIECNTCGEPATAENIDQWVHYNFESFCPNYNCQQPEREMAAAVDAIFEGHS